MEPTNHPFRKEIDLDQTFMIMELMFIFQGVPSLKLRVRPWKINGSKMNSIFEGL